MIQGYAADAATSNHGPERATGREVSEGKESRPGRGWCAAWGDGGAGREVHLEPLRHVLQVPAEPHLDLLHAQSSLTRARARIPESIEKRGGAGGGATSTRQDPAVPRLAACGIALEKKSCAIRTVPGRRADPSRGRNATPPSRVAHVARRPRTPRRARAQRPEACSKASRSVTAGWQSMSL